MPPNFEAVVSHLHSEASPREARVLSHSSILQTPVNQPIGLLGTRAELGSSTQSQGPEATFAERIEGLNRAKLCH